ncbi:methyltransferase [Pedobacter chinensis]|uniref:Methyltransferase n=1 Tax=Pedobacter chinensis TaxID=2282421 RepID=A0A369PS82_9SPHI|nr:class I SAM-dependent methyltransferase [Pedobacter chinensis]RDC55172.1 methyltransferase [Pedobacter chinensis]
MMNDRLISDTLRTLHEKAEADNLLRLEERKKAAAVGKVYGHRWETAYLAVGKPEGEFLYFIANVSGAKNIVEFGCSFGISTIYLAAAARNNGGHVITSDLEQNKVEGARHNLREAGLDNFVTILPGDAISTLSSIEGPVDLLFLDGAKELYLPVFNMLKPKLKRGAIILADNADKEEVREFNQLLTSAPDEYITSFLFDGRLLAATFI